VQAVRVLLADRTGVWLLIATEAHRCVWIAAAAAFVSAACPHSMSR
jgi:hypothetical protein